MVSSPRSWLKHDFYKVLGVSRSVTPVDLKTAFRKLVMQYHPDRFSTYAQRIWATAKMVSINEAYGVLSNPDKRANYDRLRGFQGGYSVGESPSPQSGQNTDSTKARSYTTESVGRTAGGAMRKRKWADLILQCVLWGTFLAWLVKAADIAATEYSTIKTGSIILRVMESIFLGGIVAFLQVMGFVSSWVVMGIFLMGIGYVFVEAFSNRRKVSERQSRSRLWLDLGLMFALLSIALIIVLPAFLDWPMPWLKDHTGILGIVAFTHVFLHGISLILIPFFCIEIIAILTSIVWGQSVFRRTDALMAISPRD